MVNFEQKKTCQADGRNGRGPLGERAETFSFAAVAALLPADDWSFRLPLCSGDSEDPTQLRAGARIKFSSRKMEYSPSSQQRATAIQRRKRIKVE